MSDMAKREDRSNGTEEKDLFLKMRITDQYVSRIKALQKALGTTAVEVVRLMLDTFSDELITRLKAKLNEQYNADLAKLEAAEAIMRSAKATSKKSGASNTRKAEEAQKAEELVPEAT